jgi:sulfur carrier protein ThiS
MDIFLLCPEAAILFKQEGGWVVPVEGQGSSLTERTDKEVGNIAFASLQKSVLKVEKVELDDGCTLLDLLKELGIHSSEVAITMVNGHQVTLAQTLHDAKVVAIFPPIAGG